MTIPWRGIFFCCLGLMEPLSSLRHNRWMICIDEIWAPFLTQISRPLLWLEHCINLMNWSFERKSEMIRKQAMQTVKMSQPVQKNMPMKSTSQQISPDIEQCAQSQWMVEQMSSCLCLGRSLQRTLFLVSWTSPAGYFYNVKEEKKNRNISV